MDYNRFTYELQARNFPVSKSRIGSAPHQSPATHQPPPQVGRGTYRLPTGSAHADGGAAKVKKRFSLAARHRFFGQAPKKWGRKAAGATIHLPTYRRTRRKCNDEAALSCAVTCAPFSWAIDRAGPARSTPFLCSCAKKRGRIAGQAIDYRPTYRRTRTRQRQEKGEPPARVPP